MTVVRLFGSLIYLVASFAPAPCVADEGFGQRVLGALGLDAGSQQDPGIYLGDRFIRLTADRLIGPNGRPVPIQWLNAHLFRNTLILLPMMCGVLMPATHQATEF